jgi:DNA-binding transcriptional MerR regulator
MRIGELSRRVGLSQDRLRAWERRYGLLMPRRTGGGTRLYSPADEVRVRLMQRHISDGVSPSEAAELVAAARLGIGPGAARTIPAAESATAQAEIAAALDRFDETSAQRVLERVFGAYAPVAVMRDVLLPFLGGLGERWAGSHATIAQEHFASHFVHARLLALARGWDRGLGPRAIVACPPREQHCLGAVAFGVSLHQLGWRITYLGPDTPVGMLRGAAEDLDAELVVLAAQMPEHLWDVRDDIGLLARGRAVAVGGRGATDALAERTGAHHLDADPVSAARRVCV